MGEYMNFHVQDSLNNLIKIQKRRNHEELLTKDEVKGLIGAALEKGIFDEFLRQRE